MPISMEHPIDALVRAAVEETLAELEERNAPDRDALRRAFRRKDAAAGERRAAALALLDDPEPAGLLMDVALPALSVIAAGVDDAGMVARSAVATMCSDEEAGDV